MNEIGGYFGLEPYNGLGYQDYHPEAYALNSGRNALALYLKSQNFTKIHVPKYTCHVVLDAIEDFTDMKIGFYPVSQNLEIAEPVAVNDNEVILYNNYFGIKSNYIAGLPSRFKNLIIDNAQAFYAKPVEGCAATFYSPRKFFGIPDGGYLITGSTVQEPVELDASDDRMSHLIIRLEQNASAGYEEFKKNDRSLNHQAIKRMSDFTHKMLNSFDYGEIAGRRKENFRFLHEALSGKNGISVEGSLDDEVPMVYPFVTNDKGLRRKLIRNKIYVALYWPEMENWCSGNDYELELREKLIPLPIDQRYGIREMEFILKIIGI